MKEQQHETYFIKELNEQDFDSLTGFEETLTNLSNVNLCSKIKLKELLNKINSQNGHIYVAIEDETIIGCATLLIEQKIIHDAGKVAHIEDVSTNKNHCKKGVGSNLIKKIVQDAKIAGCYKIILDCKDDLKIFYEKQGFKHHENCMRLDLI
ncbi:MAG: GNAT family N-acetyltransferase [Candidatus Woesearchaeota archaeon]|jgi:glucosamine-phosphate N-acetyltransferase